MSDNKQNPFGLTYAGGEVLFAIAWWYNGKPLEPLEKWSGDLTSEEALEMSKQLTILEQLADKRRIGNHREPSLRELFEGNPRLTWGDEHAEAHQDLLDRGFLDERYICRRKIDWYPTEQGLKVIREALKNVSEELRPRWARPDQEGPLYGDPNESLTHRKGVEVAAEYLRWDYSQTSIEYYPRSDDGAPDLQSEADLGGFEPWQVEVIIGAHNLDHLASKYRALHDREPPTWWIFESRGSMVAFWNSLHRRGLVELDGGEFSTPASKWAAKSVNRKVWESLPRGENGHVNHTLTSVLESHPFTTSETFGDFQGYYY